MTFSLRSFKKGKKKKGCYISNAILNLIIYTYKLITSCALNSYQMVFIALVLSPVCTKAYALIHTESQSRLGILWIMLIVIEATSAPFTDRESKPVQNSRYIHISYHKLLLIQINCLKTRNSTPWQAYTSSLLQHFMFCIRQALHVAYKHKTVNCSKCNSNYSSGQYFNTNSVQTPT